jgi:hypothetical protein
MTMPSERTTIPAETWQLAIAHATPEEALRIGFTAYTQQALDRAANAFEHSLARGETTVSTRAALSLGLLEEERGNLERAQQTYLHAAASSDPLVGGWAQERLIAVEQSREAPAADAKAPESAPVPVGGAGPKAPSDAPRSGRPTSSQEPSTIMLGALSQTLERWGIRPSVTDDQAALLGAEDAKTAGQAGQHRIRANDQAMLVTLGEKFAADRKPLEERLARLQARRHLLTDQLVDAKQELSRARADRDDIWVRGRILAQQRGKPFLEQRKLPLWGYLPLMAAFVIVELILTSSALQIIGESNLAVWILAGSLVIAILAICHYMGDALREADEAPGRLRKLRRLVALGALVLLFLCAIGGIRAFLTPIGITSDLVGVFILQLPVIAAAVTCAYLYSNAHARRLALTERAVRRTNRALRAIERRHVDLQGDVDAVVASKVQLVERYLERARVVQDYSRELLAAYASTYAEVGGKPPGLLELEPTDWMQVWSRWLNEQTDPLQPQRNVGKRTVVPAPNDGTADQDQDQGQD